MVSETLDGYPPQSQREAFALRLVTSKNLSSLFPTDHQTAGPSLTTEKSVSWVASLENQFSQEIVLENALGNDHVQRCQTTHAHATVLGEAVGRGFGYSIGVPFANSASVGQTGPGASDPMSENEISDIVDCFGNDPSPRKRNTHLDTLAQTSPTGPPKRKPTGLTKE